jgi:hypothetical protein
MRLEYCFGRGLRWFWGSGVEKGPGTWDPYPYTIALGFDRRTLLEGENLPLSGNLRSLLNRPVFSEAGPEPMRQTSYATRTGAALSPIHRTKPPLPPRARVGLLSPSAGVGRGLGRSGALWGFWGILARRG